MDGEENLELTGGAGEGQEIDQQSHHSKAENGSTHELEGQAEAVDMEGNGGAEGEMEEGQPGGAESRRSGMAGSHAGSRKGAENGGASRAGEEEGGELPEEEGEERKGSHRGDEDGAEGSRHSSAQKKTKSVANGQGKQHPDKQKDLSKDNSNLIAF